MISHHTRPSDSPYVQNVSSIVHTHNNLGTAMPDGYWDIVVLRQGGTTTILCTGMLTRWMPIERKAGDELLTISLKPNVFAPRLVGQRQANQALTLQTSSKHTFYFDGSQLEVPSFSNAELFVDKLIRTGVLVDDNAVRGVLRGEQPEISSRTLRRHFLNTTGVTQHSLKSIARARRALTLLQAGKPLLWVASETGYFDQPQMTKHLKQLTGQTPGEIYRHGLHTTKDLSLL